MKTDNSFVFANQAAGTYSNLSVASNGFSKNMGRRNCKDGKIFELLYKNLFASVFHFACRYVSPQDAEDITSEAFVKLWESNVELTIIPKAKAYMQICARNACLNLLRRKNIRKSIIDDLIVNSEGFEIQYDETMEIRARQLDFIIKQIAKLSKQRKRIIELFYFQGLKEREIAAELNIALGTVHNQKLRAIKLIRIALLQSAFYLLTII